MNRRFRLFLRTLVVFATVTLCTVPPISSHAQGQFRQVELSGELRNRLDRIECIPAESNEPDSLSCALCAAGFDGERPRINEALADMCGNPPTPFGEVTPDGTCFAHLFEGCTSTDGCRLERLVLQIRLRASKRSLVVNDRVYLRDVDNDLTFWSSDIAALDPAVDWDKKVEATFEISIPGPYPDGPIAVTVQDDTAVEWVALRAYYDCCSRDGGCDQETSSNEP